QSDDFARAEVRRRMTAREFRARWVREIRRRLGIVSRHAQPELRAACRIRLVIRLPRQRAKNASLASNGTPSLAAIVRSAADRPTISDSASEMSAVRAKASRLPGSGLRHQHTGG